MKKMIRNVELLNFSNQYVVGNEKCMHLMSIFLLFVCAK